MPFKADPVLRTRGAVAGSAPGFGSASFQGSRSTGKFPEVPSLAAVEAGRSSGDRCSAAADFPQRKNILLIPFFGLAGNVVQDVIA